MLVWLTDAVLLGALVATIIWNQLRLNELQHEARALRDQAHAAELRASEQIDAMLDRISTEPRLALAPAASASVDPEAQHFISDLPYADEAWNEYRHEPGEDTE